jgi:ferrous iron transport protein B
MDSGRRMKIALAGKPNSGKSSLFNLLTGLKQKVGNFPGVTVDKKSGISQLDNEVDAEIIDLPGVYSLYPRSLDEKIVAEIFSDRNNPDYPDKVLVIADATNLKSCLLLLTQLLDLGLPVVLALNMVDLAAKSGLSIDVKKLSALLDVPVVLVNARQGSGLTELRKALVASTAPSRKKIFAIKNDLEIPLKTVRSEFGLESDYSAYLYLQQTDSLNFLSSAQKQFLHELANQYKIFPGKYQGAETIRRYEFIQDVLNSVTLRLPDPEWKRSSYRLDAIFTHHIWGYVIFFAILFLIFQAIFAWAQIPMDWIDNAFASFSTYLTRSLPGGPLFELIAKGIIPGIGGIAIFIPQIAILFAFISVLEETGYMARVVFLMDKIMSKVGMSGKSVVPLMSGWACAIPAIMATRTIDHWKDRVITIFVTPFMSCSARIPVFAILVALIVPDKTLFWFFNLQGLVLMGLYVLGFSAAMFSAWIMKMIIRTKDKSYLIMEMPTYRMPKWSNVGYTIIEKTKAFVFEAGKVILAISIILWVLASYGPPSEMNEARKVVTRETANQRLTSQGFEDRVAAYKLEHSYAGIVGKAIEPAIRPLGYDWKIGIALITSFAAREVFVGTIATIYSLGSTEDQPTIKNRLKSEVNPDNGEPRFTPAVGFSLLIFYTLAMQCASTLAVVKRETKGWKWPLLQLTYMTGLAYLCAFAVFQMMR